jgi:hypothetical protein
MFWRAAPNADFPPPSSNIKALERKIVSSPPGKATAHASIAHASYDI